MDGGIYESNENELSAMGKLLRSAGREFIAGAASAGNGPLVKGALLFSSSTLGGVLSQPAASPDFWGEAHGSCMLSSYLSGPWNSFPCLFW